MSLRPLRPFVAGGAIAALVAAGAFGLLATLHRPTSDDALAVRVADELSQIHSVRSDQTLTWLKSVSARCVSHGREDTVQLSDGRTLAVRGSNVVLTQGLWRRPLLLQAEARLAGCPRLLAGELRTRLNAGKKVIDGKLSFDGEPAWRLRVDDMPPTVFVIVSRRSLKPLAVRFRTHRLVGASRLLDIRFDPA